MSKAMKRSLASMLWSTDDEDEVGEEIFKPVGVLRDNDPPFNHFLKVRSTGSATAESKSEDIPASASGLPWFLLFVRCRE